MRMRREPNSVLCFMQIYYERESEWMHIKRNKSSKNMILNSTNVIHSLKYFVPVVLCSSLDKCVSNWKACLVEKIERHQRKYQESCLPRDSLEFEIRLTCWKQRNKRHEETWTWSDIEASWDRREGYKNVEESQQSETLEWCCQS